DYLQILAEMGLLGALILAIPTIAVVRAAFFCALKAADHGTRAVALGCAGSLTAIALHSTADFNLFIPSNAMTVAWIGGIASALPLCHTFADKKARRTHEFRDSN